jgi:hypothetical protein
MDALNKKLGSLRRLPYKSMLRAIVTDLKPTIIEWNKQRLAEGKLSTGSKIRNVERGSTVPHPLTIKRKGITYFNLYDTGDFYASLTVTISPAGIMDGIITKSKSQSAKVERLAEMFTIDIYGLDEQKTEELRKRVITALKVKIAEYLNL